MFGFIGILHCRIFVNREIALDGSLEVVCSLVLVVSVLYSADQRST